MDDLPEFANIIESLNEEYDKLYDEKEKDRKYYMKIIADLENKNNDLVISVSEDILESITNSLFEHVHHGPLDLVKYIEISPYNISNRNEIINTLIDMIKEFNMNVCISNLYYEKPYNPDEYETNIKLYMFSITNDEDVRYIQERINCICPISEEPILTCSSTDCLCLNIRSSV